MKKSLYQLAVFSSIFVLSVISVSNCSAVVPPASQIIFPGQILSHYDISLAGTVDLPDTGETILILGFTKLDLFSQTIPASYLAIYKLTTSGANLVYRLAPVVPAPVGYPNPLLLETAQPVRMTASLAKTNKQLKIVTSWGETGADYFGTHPIVISYDKGKFKAVNFYNGNLAQDPQIRKITWTRPDFTVSSYFNPGEKVKTILTQGVKTADDWQIELKFYGDDEPHAAAHKFVTMLLPIFK